MMESFTCFTDDSTNIDPGIICRELPNIPQMNKIHPWWWKVWIYAFTDPGVNVWIDLDVLVVGNLDVFYPTSDIKLTTLYKRFDRPDELSDRVQCSICSWKNPIPEMWDLFTMVYDDPSLLENLSDQHYIERMMNTDKVDPKYTTLLGHTPTQDTRLIICKGEHRNPHDNLDNEYVQKYWKKI